MVLYVCVGRLTVEQKVVNTSDVHRIMHELTEKDPVLLRMLRTLGSGEPRERSRRMLLEASRHLGQRGQG